MHLNGYALPALEGYREALGLKELIPMANTFPARVGVELQNIDPVLLPVENIQLLFR